MVEDCGLHKALSVWQQAAGGGAAIAAGDHLSDDLLYRLAAPGGLQRASDEVVEHLSFCAPCQNAWSGWLESLEILAADIEEGQERTVSAGFLKAASASLFTEPLSLESSCGRFELSVYPELDNPARGLVTLEVKSVSEGLQANYCVVRDGRGTIILQGFLDDGRIAARVEELAGLDLKTWTVVISNG